MRMVLPGFGKGLKRIAGQVQKQSPGILVYQSLGFLTLIVLLWLEDSLNLTTLLFGDHPLIVRYHSSILGMLFVLVIWLLVTTSTHRFLNRIRYLEGFLKVCAWCRRIDHKGRWMPLEEFMQEGFDTPTSHGICDQCLAIQKEAVSRRKQPRPQPPGTEPAL